MGGYDYTNRIGRFPYVTAQNQSAIVEHLREHRVDSPWGAGPVLAKGTHDETGAMTAPPATDHFDAWIELWPDAAQYMVGTGAGHHLSSLPVGTPEFDTAVKAWVEFWDGYIKSKGLRPEQFALNLADEPDEPHQDARILAWAKSIRAADTKMRIWENPAHGVMSEADPNMINACHVLSPNYNSFVVIEDQDYRDYFLGKRDQGIVLEYYTVWPSRIFDPYAGRVMAWSCWRYGAEAFYFWSLMDTGYASSWNEYLTTRWAYSPVFLDEDSITAGKHLEAAREGVQDYEYFAMLDQAIQQASARGITGPELDNARQLLDSLPATVCDAAGHREKPGDEGSWTGFHWSNENVDRTLADKARIQVLAALTELSDR